MHRALRCAVVLACLGMAAAIALLVLRAWWPAVYLGLLPSPQAVIAELHAIGGVASSDPSDYRSGALAALEDRFPHAADEAALLAALAAGPPDGALADLAREWTERHPASTDAVLAAVLRHRDASAAADRALVRAAYLSISHASLPGWLRKHQEADGCWPAATAPPGPGRWRPDRAASTAFAMMALMDEGADNITPGRMKKVLQEAVAALRARQRPDGRCADDARDHAAITLALVQLYAMTSEATLRSAAQGAVTAARRDLTAGGDCAWERDTTLALLQLVALKVAADARLDVGAALDDPYRALRACWAVEQQARQQIMRPERRADRPGDPGVAGRGLRHQPRDVLGQVAAIAEEVGQHRDAGGAARDQGGEAGGDAGFGDLHVGGADHRVGAQAGDARGHVVELGVGLGAAAAVVDEEVAAHAPG